MKASDPLPAELVAVDDAFSLFVNEPLPEVCTPATLLAWKGRIRAAIANRAEARGVAWAQLGDHEAASAWFGRAEWLRANAEGAP